MERLRLHRQAQYAAPDRQELPVRAVASIMIAAVAIAVAIAIAVATAIITAIVIAPVIVAAIVIAAVIVMAIVIIAIVIMAIVIAAIIVVTIVIAAIIVIMAIIVPAIVVPDRADFMRNHFFGIQIVNGFHLNPVAHGFDFGLAIAALDLDLGKSVPGKGPLQARYKVLGKCGRCQTDDNGGGSEEYTCHEISLLHVSVDDQGDSCFPPGVFGVFACPQTDPGKSDEPLNCGLILPACTPGLAA
jgi:hypothetical protein